MHLSQPKARPVVTTAGLLVLYLMGLKLFQRSIGKQSIMGLYQLNLRQGILLALLGFAADLLAIPAVLRNKPAIDLREFEALNPQLVPAQDQVALRQNAALRDHYKQLSDQLLHASISTSALLLLHPSVRKDSWRLFVLYAFTHAVTYTFYTFSPLGPTFQNKYRPVVYYPSISRDERSRGNNRNAFYSGHTSSAAAATFCVAKLFSDAYPQLTLVRSGLPYLLAAALPFAVGYFRMKALKHFPSDVAVAFIIGALSGWGIPEKLRSGK